VTRKSNGVFIIDPTELSKLPRLYERYGVAPEEEPIPSPLSWGDFGDLGDVGSAA